MRRVTLLALALAVLVALPTSAAAETRLTDLRGTWGGTLKGVEGPTKMVVRVSGGSKGSTIAFTGGITCSGVLIYGGRSGERFAFTERITKSATPRCGGLGIVRLQLRDDDTLRYRWEPLVGDFNPSYSSLQRLLLAD